MLAILDVFGLFKIAIANCTPTGIISTKYEKRLLLRCIHHLSQALINSMDYMRISVLEPSSVILKGPTLSPAYPRIGYITLRCQSQLTGLNCLWSAKHEMRVH